VHELSLTWQIGRGCSSCDNYLVKQTMGQKLLAEFIQEVTEITNKISQKKK
jgi:hypothetical protein